MYKKDIRWIQHFNNFNKAFSQFLDAVKIREDRKLSRLEEQGLVQAFEYTHELAWNTLKDFLEERGVPKMYGSRDATREAFKAGLIENGEIWMDMIISRNQTSHTYNEEAITKIVSILTSIYFDEFLNFQARMEKLKREEE